jgi:large subunit ribosomal protein L21e
VCEWDLTHSKGYRRKTRKLFSKKKSNGLSFLLINYKLGDKVVVDINPSQVKGMPYRRFQGLMGTVKNVYKRSMTIDVPVGGKVKKVISRMEHIKPYMGKKE